MLTNTCFSVESFTYTRETGWSVPLPSSANSTGTLVLAFAAPSFMDDAAPFNDLLKAFPDSIIAGCSTSGEIAGPSLNDNSVSVAVVRFAHTRLAFASAPVRSSADSFRAGDALAQQLQGSDLRAVFILSDGLRVNGTDLVRGLNAALGDGVVVTGGLAGDGSAFKRTWVLRNGLPTEGVVSAIGFYGDRVRIGHGCRGGWDSFGPERRVTRSFGNTLFELDNQPALAIYKEYLGERAAGLPATALLFPLSLATSAAPGTRLVRTILSVDTAEQSMTFAGDIPEGSSVQLMCANFDRLIQGASDSGHIAAVGIHHSPCLCIAISCVGRRLVLRERTEEELEGTLDSLPPGSTQVGFYSYGEISPFVSGRCELHNQTMTLTTIWET